MTKTATRLLLLVLLALFAIISDLNAYRLSNKILALQIYIANLEAAYAKLKQSDERLKQSDERLKSACDSLEKESERLRRNLQLIQLPQR